MPFKNGSSDASHCIVGLTSWAIQGRSLLAIRQKKHHCRYFGGWLTPQYHNSNFTELSNFRTVSRMLRTDPFPQYGKFACFTTYHGCPRFSDPILSVWFFYYTTRSQQRCVSDCPGQWPAMEHTPTCLSVWFFIILPGPSRGAPPRATVPGSGLAQTPRSAHSYVCAVFFFPMVF